MKKLIIISLLILQSFTSFSQETIVKNDIAIDEFITAFYKTQNTPEQMIPFFDKNYYESKFKFVEHIKLKNKKSGMFLEGKLKSKRISPNRNIIRLKYRVKYEKYSTNDKIFLKKNIETNKYEIFHWKTRR